MLSKLIRFLLWTSVLAPLSLIVPGAAQNFVNPLRIVTPVDPYTVVVGDVNGDGLIDILWGDTSSSPATLHVLLATANGGYQVAPNVALPVNTLVECYIADFNRDGNGDLICTAAVQFDSSIEVFLGNGDGTFRPPVVTALTSPSGGNYVSPLVGVPADLNGDGIPDVVMQDISNYGGGVLISDGKGGFGPLIPFSLGENESFPIVADLNGDGKADLFYPAGPAVALGNGDGTFKATINYYPSAYSTCILHDMDGDGHPDAICGYTEAIMGDADGATHLTVLHGNPDGSFNNTAPIVDRSFGDHNTNADGTGTFEFPLAVADLNGDGIPDVIGQSGDGLVVLLGEAQLSFGAPKHYAQADTGWRGDVSPYQSQILDVNGDGIVDLIAIGPNGIYLTYGRPDGTFASAPAVEVAEVIGYSAVADYNGDGIPDIAATGDTAIKVSIGKGDGTFASPVALPNNNGAVNFSTPLSATNAFLQHGDFNGDGLQDLIAIGSPSIYVYNSYVLFGKGNGIFADPVLVPDSMVSYSGQSATAGAAVLDINRDGKDDLVFMLSLNGGANFQVVSELSKGDGSFTAVNTDVPADTANGWTNTRVAMADFDGDGKPDAAYGGYNNLYFLRGNGDGSFTTNALKLPVPSVGAFMSKGVVSVATGDFDGDGHQDLVALVQYGQGLVTDPSVSATAAWVYFGRGDGTFSSPTLVGPFDQNYGVVAAHDLNKDGLADLVFQVYGAQGSADAVGVVLAQTPRTFGAETDYTAGTGLTSLAIADVNRDGYPDLLFGNGDYNELASSVTVLLNTGPDKNVSGVLTAMPEPSFVGQAFKLRAALTPPAGSTAALGGTVSFSVDGVAVGSAAVVGGVASVPGSTTLAAGVHQLAATWSGDSKNPSLNMVGSHTVTLVPVKVSVVSSVNPSAVGQSVKFTVQVTATPNGPFSGALSLYDGTTLLGTQTNAAGTYSFTTSALTTGVHAISASYAGDREFAAGSGSLNQTVNGLSVSMGLDANPNPAVAGSRVSLTARLKSSGSCAACSLSADVEFSDGGVSLGSAPVNAGGVATLSATFATVGTHALLASYPGDSDHDAGSASLNEEVLRADTTLTLMTSATPVAAGTAVTFTAHLSSKTASVAGVSIVFSDGGNALGSVAVDATGVATLTTASLGVGSHTIKAALAETATLNGSSATVVEVVTKAATGIVLTGAPNPVYQNQALTLNVALSTPSAFPATGTVQLLDGNAVIGTPAIAANSATFSTSALSVGKHTLTAVYAGDTNTLPGTSSPLVVTVLASDFVLKSTPATISVKTEHHLTFSVSAQSVGMFADELTLSTAALPAHMTVDFASSTMNLSSGGTGTVSVHMDTDDVHGYARAVPAGRLGGAGTSPVWALLPAPFLLLLVRGKKRTGLSLMLLACLMVPLFGCSGLYPKSTPPGTYTVQIHAVGKTTGVAHTLNLEVTVLP